MNIHDRSIAAQPTAGHQRFNSFLRLYYRCLTRRANELFELTDALLWAPGKVADDPKAA